MQLYLNHLMWPFIHSSCNSYQVHTILSNLHLSSNVFVLFNSNFIAEMYWFSPWFRRMFSILSTEVDKSDSFITYFCSFIWLKCSIFATTATFESIHIWIELKYFWNTVSWYLKSLIYGSLNHILNLLPYSDLFGDLCHVYKKWKYAGI